MGWLEDLGGERLNVEQEYPTLADDGELGSVQVYLFNGRIADRNGLRKAEGSLFMIG